MTGTDQNNGEWLRKPSKFSKKFHFVLSGEIKSLCGFHKSRFSLKLKINKDSKKCQTCIDVLNTYSDLTNRPIIPDSLSNNFRSHSALDYEFKFDGSRRYY